MEERWHPTGRPIAQYGSRRRPSWAFGVVIFVGLFVLSTAAAIVDGAPFEDPFHRVWLLCMGTLCLVQFLACRNANVLLVFDGGVVVENRTDRVELPWSKVGRVERPSHAKPAALVVDDGREIPLPSTQHDLLVADEIERQVRMSEKDPAGSHAWLA